MIVLTSVRLGLQNRSCAGDFDCLGDLTDFHLHVEARGLVQDQREGWIDRALESWRADFKLVVADREAGDVVETRCRWSWW